MHEQPHLPHTHTLLPVAHIHYRNMSSAAPLLGRILANSVSLANKSAQIARDIMASGELGVTEKTGVDDLQTKADRSIQACVVTSLRRNFPGLAVIGEEKGPDSIENNLA